MLESYRRASQRDAPALVRRHGTSVRSLLMLVDGLIAGGLLTLFLGLLGPSLAPTSPLAAEGVGLPLVAGYAGVWVRPAVPVGRLPTCGPTGSLAERPARRPRHVLVRGARSLVIASGRGRRRRTCADPLPAPGRRRGHPRTRLRVAFSAMRRRGLSRAGAPHHRDRRPGVDFARLVPASPSLGVRIVGFLGDRPRGRLGATRTWAPSMTFRGSCARSSVDEVAVCVPPTQWRVAEAYARLAHQEGLVVRVPLMVPHLASSRAIPRGPRGTAVLSFTNGPDELAGRAVKRTFDLVIALTAVVLLGPLMLAIATMLRLREGPGVIFKQTRVGTMAVRSRSTSSGR